MLILSETTGAFNLRPVLLRSNVKQLQSSLFNEKGTYYVKSLHVHKPAHRLKEIDTIGTIVLSNLAEIPYLTSMEYMIW